MTGRRRQRLMDRHRRVALIAGVVSAVLAVGACDPAAIVPTTSPSPSAGGVSSPDQAMAAVRARTPLFDGLERKDPNLIGQGSWWDAPQGIDSYPITVQVGWGDCQAGCIDRHTWTWDVGLDGSTAFGREEGSPLTDDVLAGLQGQSRSQGIGGRVTAGPTCPVERPNDPTCAARMVGNATLVVTDASGTEVARFVTDGSGLFRLALDPGEYTVQASQVEALMGTPGPATVEVRQGAETWLDVTYDTGIR
jgi:carboxypeptidase family protein